MQFQITQKSWYSLFFVSLGLVFLHCGNSGNSENKLAPELSQKIKGNWNVSTEKEGDDQPKREVFSIYPEEKRAILSEKPFDLQFDSLGMRVLPGDTEFPIAYFLFSELGSTVWVGTWDERVVRLLRD